METNKLIAGIVAAAIAVIVLAGVLMPALSNATDTEDTFSNTGYFYMTDTDNHTYVFDGTKWTIDDVVSTVPLAGVNIIATDTFFIRDVGQVRGGYNVTFKSCNLTVNNGAITGSYVLNDDSTGTANWSFTKFYGATTTSGDYIMTKNTNNPIAYVKGDTDIFGFGQTNIGTQVNFQVTGNLNDGISVTTLSPGVTISDISYNITPVSGYLDLYTFTSVTFTATYNGDDTVCTYNILVVPSEVTAEKAQHLTDAQIVILDVIPLLIIVSVLLGVVAVFILRRE